jgi:dolichol-phosphate mannosyltransferase
MPPSRDEPECGRLVPEVRIVIPAHDEAARIEGTVRDFCDHFGDRATVVVVANGCADETVSIVRSLRREYPNLQLVDITHPIGKGGAVRLGLKSGDEPFVGYADADDSASARQLDGLLERCRREQVAGVIASRWIRGATILRRQPLKRRIASRIFNGIVRLTLGLPYTDTQCGAKIFRRDAVKRVLSELELANFAFDVDLLYALKRFGFRVIEAPIVWEDSPENSTIKLIPSACSMLLSLARLRIRYGRLRRLPYSDLVGRNGIIPAKTSLTLVVVDADAERWTNDETFSSLIAAWRADGHVVHLLSARGPRDMLKALAWYLRRGQYEAEAIVDMGSTLSWLTRFSSKPKLVFPFDWEEGEQPTLRRLGFGPSAEADELARAIVEKLMSATPLHTRFYEKDGGWHITLPGGSREDPKTIAI